METFFDKYTGFHMISVAPDYYEKPYKIFNLEKRQGYTPLVVSSVNILAGILGRRRIL
jgi:hypothetical protein